MSLNVGEMSTEVQDPCPNPRPSVARRKAPRWGRSWAKVARPRLAQLARDQAPHHVPRASND